MELAYGDLDDIIWRTAGLPKSNARYGVVTAQVPTFQSGEQKEYRVRGFGLG